MLCPSLRYLMSSPELPEYWLLLDWIMENAPKISLSFSTFSWLNQPPGLPKKTVYAEINYQNQKFFGLGNAMNERLGHAIAAAEAIERVMMVHLNLSSSNGCAVHMDPARARAASLKELVERDSFLCHFSTGTKLFAVPLSQRQHELKEWVRSQGAEMHIGALENALGCNGVVVGIKGFSPDNQDAFFLGLGLSDSWEDAIERAFPEAWRYRDSWMREASEFTPLTLTEFETLKRKSVRDHVRLSMDPKYSHMAWNRLFSNLRPTPLTNTKKLSALLDKTVYLEMPASKIFSDCPLFFSHAKNSMLAELDFGDNWQKSINHDRFQSFAPDHQILEKIPHCLG